MLTNPHVPDAVLKAIKPDLFHGRESEDIDRWLKQLDDYFQVANITNASTKTCAARLLLRDVAADWAQLNLPELLDESLLWETFQAKLSGRFENINAAEIAREKIYDKFEKLHTQARDLTDAEALTCFMRGLKPQIRLHFAGNPILATTLSSVQHIAESYDRVQFRFRNILPTNFHKPAYDPMAPGPMDLDAMQTHVSNSRSLSSAKQKQKDFQLRTCFYCHKPGHQAKSCPEKFSSNSGRPKSENVKSQQRPLDLCMGSAPLLLL
ncbi:hypothetical protein BGZ58_000744 [Dissophora ornata]|nr:hypothetical protein BGZ58_000744 [Dissophora ornata]